MKSTKKIHYLHQDDAREGSKCHAFTYRNIRITDDLTRVTCERCLIQINGTNNNKLYSKYLNKDLKELEQRILMSRG